MKFLLFGLALALMAVSTMAMPMEEAAAAEEAVEVVPEEAVQEREKRQFPFWGNNNGHNDWDHHDNRNNDWDRRNDGRRGNNDWDRRDGNRNGIDGEARSCADCSRFCRNDGLRRCRQQYNSFARRTDYFCDCKTCTYRGGRRVCN